MRPLPLPTCPDAVQLVLGIRRSARAVQHAGPAGPPEGARRGGSKVGGRRSSPRLLMVPSSPNESPLLEFPFRVWDPVLGVDWDPGGVVRNDACLSKSSIFSKIGT